MEQIDLERFVLKVKGELNRDRRVIGVVLMGEEGMRRLCVIVDTDTPVGSVELAPILAQARMVLLSAHGLVLFQDGSRLDYLVCTADAFGADPVEPYRILLDKGGVNRLMRSLAARPTDADGAEHVSDPAAAVIRLWDCFATWQSGDRYVAARRLDRTLDEIRAGMPELDAETLFSWRARSVPEVVREVLGLLAALPQAPLAAIGQVLSRITPEPHAPIEVRVEVADVPAVQPGPRLADASRGCLACGSTSREKGYLYQKGTLNDIRWLAENAPRMDFKKKVEALLCSACGHIALVLEDR